MLLGCSLCAPMLVGGCESSDTPQTNCPSERPYDTLFTACPEGMAEGTECRYVVSGCNSGDVDFSYVCKEGRLKWRQDDCRYPFDSCYGFQCRGFWQENGSQEQGCGEKVPAPGAHCNELAFEYDVPPYDCGFLCPDGKTWTVATCDYNPDNPNPGAGGNGPADTIWTLDGACDR